MHQRGNGISQRGCKFTVSALSRLMPGCTIKTGSWFFWLRHLSAFLVQTTDVNRRVCVDKWDLRHPWNTHSCTSTYSVWGSNKNRPLPARGKISLGSKLRLQYRSDIPTQCIDVGNSLFRSTLDPKIVPRKPQAAPHQAGIWISKLL